MISGVGMVLPQEMRREADLLLLSMIAIQNVPTLRDQERMNIIITHRRVKLGAQ